MNTVVIFTTHAFSLLNFRGKLIKELISRSHKVHAIAPDFDEESRNKIRSLGAIPHDCLFERTGLNIISDLRACIHLFKLLKTIKPDCLLSYFIKPVIYGTVCGFLAGINLRVAMIEGLGSVFVEDEGTQSLGKKLRLFIVKKMYKFALYYASKVIFLNQDDISEFDRWRIFKSDKAILLGGIGVDLDEWVNRKPYQKAITFTLAARLLREKGVEIFVDAAKKVKAIHPDCRFVLLGKVDLNPSSITVKELNSWVDDKVIEWPGHVSVIKWFSETSVFVLPSYYREGIPRSSQEALAMCLPIITTDTVGCRETVIDGFNGYLVPIKDVDALVEKMLIFINNPQLINKMGKKSRIIAEKYFDEKVKIAQQLEILDCT